MRHTFAGFRIECCRLSWAQGRCNSWLRSRQCPGGRGSRGPGGSLTRKEVRDENAYRNLLLGVLAGLLAAGAETESPGCTDFRIQAADGTVIIGRTMDFEVPVLSAVRIFPRGERWCSEAPGTSGGISWTSKYGYIAVDMGGRLVDPLDRAENLADGLNEKGLSFGWLSMPDFTAYQDQAAAGAGESHRPPGPVPLPERALPEPIRKAA